MHREKLSKAFRTLAFKDLTNTLTLISRFRDEGSEGGREFPEVNFFKAV